MFVEIKSSSCSSGDESVVSDTNVNQTNQTKHNWESLDLGSILFVGSEIRRSPVEVGSWNPIMYKVSKASHVVVTVARFLPSNSMLRGVPTKIKNVGLNLMPHKLIPVIFFHENLRVTHPPLWERWCGRLSWQQLGIEATPWLWILALGMWSLRRFAAETQQQCLATRHLRVGETEVFTCPSARSATLIVYDGEKKVFWWWRQRVTKKQWFNDGKPGCEEGVRWSTNPIDIQIPAGF